MARVYLHIGLPKTGTTYLQQILWGHRDELAAQGIVLPGRGHREHLWAALDAQERRRLARRHPDAPGAWGRLARELVEDPAPVGLVTHEFFCGASAEQAVRAVARLAPATVHVVITARHALGMLTAGWQELVKNGEVVTPREAAADNRPWEFSWQTWDLGGVLERWSHAVPPERIHLVPMPEPGSPPDQHWRNFASVVGIEAEIDPPAEPANSSLGVVQVELLRRINADLGAFRSPFDRGQWIRGYLAEGHLALQDGERFALDDDLVAECRARSEAAVDLILERGVDVVGNVESLRVPENLPPARPIDSVTSEELLSSASALVASMLEQARRDAAAVPPKAKDEVPSPHGLLAGVRRRLRRRNG